MTGQRVGYIRVSISACRNPWVATYLIQGLVAADETGSQHRGSRVAQCHDFYRQGIYVHHQARCHPYSIVAHLGMVQ